MSEETYYTVLNVKETASPSEIKTAYRDLIKQVHPDTIATLAPYLRRIAEDKAKEITEAHSVLSNSRKRQDYDNQLAAYRRQNAPQASSSPSPTTSPPTQHATAQPSSGAYCNRCGTPLYASGFCPKCNRPLRWFGYNWGPLLRWSRQHPLLTLGIPVFLVWLIATLASNDTSPQAPAQATHAASVTRVVTPESTVHPAASEISAPVIPRISISGTYIGTVHNQTANLSSTFIVVMHQGKAGVLDGCVEVKPPLYGSGALSGSISGSHVGFSVADIRFNGSASKNAIGGSYVVSRQDGQQLGDFRLTKQTGPKEFYGCDKGAVMEFEIDATPTTKTPVTHLPNSSNSTVETTTITATGSKFPAATSARPSTQPDLSSMTFRATVH